MQQLIYNPELGKWLEIFEVLQKEITSKRRTVNEINIKAIQEAATDIGALVKYTSDIKGRTAKI